ncbi:MAG TPA: IS1595 family transposase [Bryobacteraceae bacterium]|nr:IS1595 family transposase [Bryobacteraceae bacterium]
MDNGNAGKPSLHDAVIYFADYQHCHDFMVSLRWPDGKVKCPQCGAEKVCYLAKNRVWKCYAPHPKPRFTLKTGTIFEDSPIGLEKWLPAVWMLLNCKNGISSWELHRALGVTQKTAWFMLHRIRLAMKSQTFNKLGGPGGGVVEVDETFIGGKTKNMHPARKRKVQAAGRNIGGKAIVMGMLERNGTVRTAVIEERTKKVMQPIVQENVEPGSTVHSDEWGSNWRMDDQFTHQLVNHLESYVADNVHTNCMENFWSLLKRCLNGTYIAVEPYHLFRYVDEEAFRYNNRDMDDMHRFVFGGM